MKWDPGYIDHCPLVEQREHRPRHRLIGCDRSIMLFISGLQLEALAYELSGTLVRDISYPGAVFRDGRLRRGDLILFLNHECLWRVTSSQAKIVLRRADFVTNGIP